MDHLGPPNGRFGLHNDCENVPNGPSDRTTATTTTQRQTTTTTKTSTTTKTTTTAKMTMIVIELCEVSSGMSPTTRRLDGQQLLLPRTTQQDPSQPLQPRPRQETIRLMVNNKVMISKTKVVLTFRVRTATKSVSLSAAYITIFVIHHL